MRRRLCPPWFSCLKTALRRSETRRILAALFLLSPVLLVSQTDIRITEMSPGVYSLYYRTERTREEISRLMDRVNSGMTADVEYEIRIFRGRPGRFPVSRLESLSVSCQGAWDPFTRSYAVFREGDSRLFTREEDFLNELLVLKDYPLSLTEIPPGSYTLKVRAKVRNIKLLPPLNILAPLQSLLWVGLPWSSLELIIPHGTPR